MKDWRKKMFVDNEKENNIRNTPGEEGSKEGVALLNVIGEE